MTFRTAAFALAAFCVSSAAFADDCAAPMAATLNGAKWPHSLTSTNTGPGGATTGHAVWTGKQFFVEVGGKWLLTPETAARIADMMADNMKGAKITCHARGGEAVAGEAAAVYDIHVVNDDSVSDNRVWISKTGNKVLKSQVKLDSGDTIVSLYDYKNFAPPKTYATHF
jgi:hypothetical protein